MVQFQIIDILSDDIDYKFTLTLYGKTAESKNIVCNLTEFKPYFYIIIPDTWYLDEEKLKKILFNIIYSDLVGSYRYKMILQNVDLEIVKYKKFYRYTNKQENFIKLSFDNMFGMNDCIRRIKDIYKYFNKLYNNIDYKKLDTKLNEEELEKSKDSLDFKSWVNIDNNCECGGESNLYESKVHPIIRFIHEMKIKTGGWVEVDFNEKNIQTDIYNCDLFIDDLYFKQVKSLDIDSITSLRIASFDIECDSSHGDFPTPIKDFKRLASEIYDYYIKIQPDDYDFKKTIIETNIEKAFLNPDKDISKIYIKNQLNYDNLDDVMDLFTEDIFNKLDNLKNRNDNINIINKLLCELKNKKNNLEVEGDPIIQIGTVFYDYGIVDSYQRVMIMMGPTEKMDYNLISEDIDGVEIIKCDDERDLLLKWKNLIFEKNPDILTGYNIFGFDFDYICERVKILFDECNLSKKRVEMEEYFKCEFYKLGKLLRPNK